MVTPSLPAATETAPKKQKNRPSIKESIQLKLWLKAGGLCSFHGCQEPLNYDSLTLHETNFSNIAHIVAFSEDGPRGKHPLPAARRNDYDNLMLVCTHCHKLIDSKENEHKFPADLLHSYKHVHEEQIGFARELVQKRSKTHLVRCRANIQNEMVQISLEEIQDAIHPRYPASRHFTDLDLTRFAGDDSPAYWQSKKQEISKVIEKMLTPGGATDTVEHISVLAMGPMPLLIHLGNCLSNKIPTDLYQRHRDTERWAWKAEGKVLDFTFNKIKDGTSNDVVVAISLSGRVRLETLTGGPLEAATIYEISLNDEDPSLTFLNRKETLANFRVAYRNAISQLDNRHPGLKTIHLLPAVPAPIAVLCGRELLHKVDPVLAVYDFNKNKNGFDFTMEVNNGC